MRNLEQSDRDQAIAARDQHQVRELKIFEGSRAFAIFARDQHKVRAEKIFKGSRARPLTARDQTLKIRSAPSGRRADRDQIPVDRDQYRGFRKIRPINSRISLIFAPKHSKFSLHLQKLPINTTQPPILAKIAHNPETHLPIFHPKPPLLKLGKGGRRTERARASGF